MLETLDGAAVRRWCSAGLAALRRHEHEINQLNVYPVPDGDTGTNLVLTVTAAEQALDRDPGGEVGAVLRVMARGALLGARGNSGVIVAQWLRGLADTLTAGTATGPDLAQALAAAAKGGYTAVAEPVEGTILTVATAAARSAAGDGLAAVTRSAADGAATALARTPEQLPVLAAAGVVDAGGRGLVVLLDALVEVVAGSAPPRERSAPASVPLHCDGSEAYEYEVQYLLDADDQAVDRLQAVLGRLGDSLVVVGTGEGTWNVHVHVDDVGAAIEAGVEAGRPYRISVTKFDDARESNRDRSDDAREPYRDRSDDARESNRDRSDDARESNRDRSDDARESNRDRSEDQAPARDPAARGAVVMARGDGLVALFEGEGSVVIGGNPSTGEVLAGIRATRAAHVVVLPNDPNTQAVASAAAEEAAAAGIRVSVVPTHSPVQALAALAIRDPARRFEDDVIAMAEAAGACRYAEVCHASREAITIAGRCRAGDVLALVEGEVHLIGTELDGVCRQLLDQLLGGGGELVTLVTGADAPDRLGEALTEHLTAAWPFVEVQVHHGGQPSYPLLVGVE